MRLKISTLRLKMLRGIFGFRRADSGTAAIEFGIFGSLMAMLFVVGADLGFAFYSDMQVQTSAHSGATYAILKGYDASAIKAAVTNATGASGISASPDPVEFCGCPSDSGLSTATCGTNCADGAAAGTYVTVTATRTHTMLIPYPILSDTVTQKSVATVRIQ